LVIHDNIISYNCESVVISTFCKYYNPIIQLCNTKEILWCPRRWFCDFFTIQKPITTKILPIKSTTNVSTSTSNTIQNIIKYESYGQLFKHQIKIASVNVGGNLSSKVKNINCFLHQEQIDIMCLQETHMFSEQLNLLKAWFENKHYKIIYLAKSQKDFYNTTKNHKIKEIQSSLNLS